MININTILSTFDEKGTLLKWLKTTNDALKNASLKSVEAVQPTATTLQLKFIFADDSSLLSPPITLPKGEQGDPGKDATLPGFINFFSGQLGTTSYDTNEFNFKAPFEMKSTETGEVLKNGDFNFKILIGGSDFISVDLDESDSFLQIKLDETKVDTEVKENSTNLITSGGAFKNDPLVINIESFTLDNLQEGDIEKINAGIKKALILKKPLIICGENYNFFYGMTLPGNVTVVFIGNEDDDYGNLNLYYFTTEDEENYSFFKKMRFTPFNHYSFSITEDNNYNIVFNAIEDSQFLSFDGSGKENIDNLFKAWQYHLITNLSLYSSEFNKDFNIIELTFSNETDYTFYYLENGVIKSVIIDASIIQ